jgi:flagellin FlaB
VQLRGIVGIEAAIVLIAFVLVASALAFVAINMGMFSAQKSKEVMAKAREKGLIS